MHVNVFMCECLVKAGAHASEHAHVRAHACALEQTHVRIFRNMLPQVVAAGRSGKISAPNAPVLRRLLSVPKLLPTDRSRVSSNCRLCPLSGMLSESARCGQAVDETDMQGMCKRGTAGAGAKIPLSLNTAAGLMLPGLLDTLVLFMEV